MLDHVTLSFRRALVGLLLATELFAVVGALGVQVAFAPSVARTMDRAFIRLRSTARALGRGVVVVVG